QVETDASGNITRWEINLGKNIAGLSMLTQKVTSFFTEDQSRLEVVPDVNFWSAAILRVGTWGAPTSDGGDPTAVPEPASLLLVVSGLIGSAMRGRRSSH